MGRLADILKMLLVYGRRVALIIGMVTTIITFYGSGAVDITARFYFRSGIQYLVYLSFIVGILTLFIKLMEFFELYDKVSLSHPDGVVRFLRALAARLQLGCDIVIPFKIRLFAPIVVG